MNHKHKILIRNGQWPLEARVVLNYLKMDSSQHFMRGSQVPRRLCILILKTQIWYEAEEAITIGYDHRAWHSVNCQKHLLRK